MSATRITKSRARQAPRLTETREGRTAMMYGWGSGGWVSWLVMTLVMLVFWGGLAALVVWGIRGFGREGSKTDRLNILRERFALGEIDQQEFESRRAVLGKS
jgi:putative membrane protein